MRIELNAYVVPEALRPNAEKLVKRTWPKSKVDWVEENCSEVVLSMTPGEAGQRGTHWTRPGDPPAPMIDATDLAMGTLEGEIQLLLIQNRV